ncbi:MAG: methyl-accepting chemotaxis protein [Reinekea sp.]|jgi:methyl-accepting chemotaxis protein
MMNSLRTQIYTLVLIPLLIIGSVCAWTLIRTASSLGDSVSNIAEQAVLDAERHRLQSTMESVSSLLKPYLDMPGETGKADALAMLKGLSFDDGIGYIFGYDYNGVRVLLGQSDAGLGQNLIDLQDKKGQYLIRNMRDIARDEGSGFITYYFPKPNEKEPSPKYSYVIGIDQWNIYLGTGLYFDSVDRVLADINNSLAVLKKHSLLKNLSITSVILILALLASAFAVRALLSGLSHLAESVAAFASGKGDLTTQLPARGIRELDYISQQFNEFVTNLAQDISLLKTTGRRLMAMSSEVSRNQIRLSHEVDQQRENTLQFASSVEEMSATINDVASNAENAREVTASVKEGIGQVLDQVNQSSGRIEELGTILTKVDSSVQELGGNVDSINSALSVIQSISEQTNLLALNAAIEAARAGDQGRGFAVVADEVRSLAQRSRQSTIEISDILEKLKTSTERTTADVGTTVESREAVNQAMNTIRELVMSSTESTGQLAEINTLVATAATEQTSVANEITRSINDIAQFSEQILEGSEQTKQQFLEVEEMAKQIDLVSGKFTVS